MALTKTGTDGIKDDAVTLDKLSHGTSGQNGKFLRANNGAAPSFETVDVSNASNLSTGIVPSARISEASVTQHVTPFDDNKVINDISALALKISALENSTAASTNSTFAETYQDSNNITSLTNVARDTTGEYVSTNYNTSTSYQFDQSGTHGQPELFKINASGGSSNTNYWTNDQIAESSQSGDYNHVGVDFAFDLSGDFVHYFYHRVNGSGQATSIAFPAASILVSPKTDITSGKDPTYNGSTIWDVDLSANESGTEGVKGSYRLDQCINGLFSTAVESHLGISSIAGGVGAYTTTPINLNYSTDANSDGLYTAKYFNTGSNRHGVKFTYTKSTNTLTAEFTEDDIGTPAQVSLSNSGKITITNLPTTGRVFLFYGNANGGSSTTQYIGMKTDATGVGVSSGTFLAPTFSATGSYESTAITAPSSTSKMGVVVTYIDASGTATLNTDLKLYVSADNGSNYTQVTLAGQSDFSTGVKMAKANDVSVTAGTQLKYKVEFANQAQGSKETRVTGVSLQY